MISGDSNIIWKESNRVISAGTTIIRKDPRLSLQDGYDLRIDDLQETDSGKKLQIIDFTKQNWHNVFRIFFRRIRLRSRNLWFTSTSIKSA